jgi:hypothetical protein
MIRTGEGILVPGSRSSNSQLPPSPGVEAGKIPFRYGPIAPSGGGESRSKDTIERAKKIVAKNSWKDLIFIWILLNTFNNLQRPFYNPYLFVSKYEKNIGF